ncbi:MAG TPA: KGK domain-containing protein [Nodularia sp. (in: cyanobacteria)]|nr:KGK domain-containing protein [Nodularia sp. (in: cyanobacteria)]
MNNKFTLLDCDDDVVLFEKDTFKINRLKDLAKNYIRNILQQLSYDNQGKYLGKSILDNFKNIAIGKHKITSNEFRYSYTTTCQLLKIGSQGWQQGTLKIQVFISPLGEQLDEVLLEFAPDQVHEMESCLDDLRKQIQI